MFPEVVHQPTLHNPFPQLSKVAVAPFFNLSLEPTLNVRNVANAYCNELQLLPGFEVVAVAVVEQAMRENHILLRDAADARRLAQILGVDAVVIGAVTDYSPYYPPRMAMQVEWYAANPNFHPIPPGYGLPWGTPAEKEIPGPLVFEAELALAKAQLQTQTPPYEKLPAEVPDPRGDPPAMPGPPATDAQGQAGKAAALNQATAVRTVAHQEPAAFARPGSTAQGPVPGLPPDWPDARGFVPPPPLNRPPAGHPTERPVLQHTRTYNGHDPEFVEALENYCYFRNDARLGGWQGYLQRSDDFIRFCCHTHVWEMLAARGGAGESRVVWRWSGIR
ncbi:MAG: hypothetical protein ABSG86_27545 [Thermoguttaceae bacterium]